MTTTLRPSGPEQRSGGGKRARSYTVCVNGRPVGAVELSTGQYGPTVGHLSGLTIDVPDRRRGRGTVAALAGEEVLRSWGCTYAVVAVPAGAAHALRMATALGYAERNRHMAKPLDHAGDAGHTGSALRPLTRQEYAPWWDGQHEAFVASLLDIGMPRADADAWATATVGGLFADGEPAPGTGMYALAHDGTDVAGLWLRTAEPAWVYSVEVAAPYRGRGHGRAVMRAAEDACRAAGARTLGLNVFVGNATAVRLYTSLGYEVVARYFAKPLL